MHLMNMHDMHMVCAMKLIDWLTQENISDEAFGRRVGRSQSQISRIKCGLSRPSLDLVEVIDRETGGLVAVDDWINKVQAA